MENHELPPGWFQCIYNPNASMSIFGRHLTVLIYCIASKALPSYPLEELESGAKDNGLWWLTSLFSGPEKA